MKITLTADIHFNSNNLSHHTKVFNEMIDKSSGDYLIIAGDYFDKEESFEKDILKILPLKKALDKFKKIFIIKGTDSHDNTKNQNHLLSACLLGNIEYINTAQECEIEGKKILFLPEEYPLNRNKFYKKFFEKTYDLIVGHGNIIGAKTTTGYVLTPEEYQLKGFYAKDLSKISKFTFFGHIHNHQMLCDNVGYIGSLTKNNFADTDKKGFIELDLALNYYKRISIESNQNFLTFDIKQITNFNKIESLLENEKNKIRIFISSKEELNKIPLHLIDKIKVVIKTPSNESFFNDLIKATNNFDFEEYIQNPSKIYKKVIENDKSLSKKKREILIKTIEKELEYEQR